MNPGRQYDPALVQYIQDNVRYLKDDNLTIELRPVPDDLRSHALDPRVAALYELRRAGAFLTPKGSDLISMRTRPNKENHRIDGGDISERVVPMTFSDRIIQLFVFTPSKLVPGRPALLYFHGGGFTVGNIEQFRNALRYIAETSRCVVLYPEYRLAPECPFPGAIRDCNDTVNWVAKHADELSIDAGRLALAGDSAGGGLCNSITMLQRDTARIKLIVEMYPLTDAGPVPKEWSHDLYPCLPEQKEAAMSRVDRTLNASGGLIDSYLSGMSALAFDPLVSAYYYPRLDEFPRTIVVTSEFDYLRYQNQLFAKKLFELGVDVCCIRYLGCDHGFFEMCGVMPQVEDLCRVIANELVML